MYAEAIFYNVGNASASKVERDLVRLAVTHDPQVIMLCEIGDRHSVVQAAATKVGYRVRYGAGGPGAERLAALSRPGINVEKVWTVKISDRTKVGRRTAGARRTGYAAAKYIMGVRYSWTEETDSGKPKKHRAVVGGTHLVPSAMKRGNTATRNLHGRQVAACVRWLRARGFAAMLLGDFNIDPTRAGEKDLLRPLTSEFDWDGHPSHGKRAIDLAFSNRKVRVRTLDGYSSDHKPILATIIGK